jgi:hypothetical protein
MSVDLLAAFIQVLVVASFLGKVFSYLIHSRELSLDGCICLDHVLLGFVLEQIA